MRGNYIPSVYGSTLSAMLGGAAAAASATNRDETASPPQSLGAPKEGGASSQNLDGANEGAALLGGGGVHEDRAKSAGGKEVRGDEDPVDGESAEVGHRRYIVRR